MDFWKNILMGDDEKIAMKTYYDYEVDILEFYKKYVIYNNHKLIISAVEEIIDFLPDDTKKSLKKYINLNDNIKKTIEEAKHCIGAKKCNEEYYTNALENIYYIESRLNNTADEIADVYAKYKYYTFLMRVVSHSRTVIDTIALLEKIKFDDPLNKETKIISLLNIFKKNIKIYSRLSNGYLIDPEPHYPKIISIINNTEDIIDHLICIIREYYVYYTKLDFKCPKITETNKQTTINLMWKVMEIIFDNSYNLDEYNIDDADICDTKHDEYEHCIRKIELYVEYMRQMNNLKKLIDIQYDTIYDYREYSNKNYIFIISDMLFKYNKFFNAVKQIKAELAQYSYPFIMERDSNKTPQPLKLTYL
jgi:hypothetical protein